MMEFIFCLLNHMKFYLIYGMCEICMNKGIKKIFFTQIGICNRWKVIDKLYLDLWNFVIEYQNEKLFNFYHYYDILYSTPVGYHKSIRDSAYSMRQRHNNQKQYRTWST